MANYTDLDHLGPIMTGRHVASARGEARLDRLDSAALHARNAVSLLSPFRDSRDHWAALAELERAALEIKYLFGLAPPPKLAGEDG